MPTASFSAWPTRPNQSLSRNPINATPDCFGLGNFRLWCGRGDSNPHGIATASPSSWCVCQFRHFRAVGNPVYEIRPVPDTRTARIELSDVGVVIVRIRNGARQSVSDASENVSTAIATRGGQRRPILVDIRQAAPLAADVRRMYSGRNIADAFTALALLIDTSPLGRTMGNVYLKIARLPMPMKMFVEESQALVWLDAHRDVVGPEM